MLQDLQKVAREDEDESRTVNFIRGEKSGSDTIRTQRALEDHSSPAMSTPGNPEAREGERGGQITPRLALSPPPASPEYPSPQRSFSAKVKVGQMP